MLTSSWKGTPSRPSASWRACCREGNPARPEAVAPAGPARRAGARRRRRGLRAAAAGGGDGALLAVDGAIDGSLGDVGLDRVVTRDVAAELDAGTSGVRHYGEHGEARQDEVAVFVETYAPPPRMLIFGAVDFTAALVRVAKV